ncbi:(S)-2-haloacid dehalogenase 4A [Kingella potus]|uniref:(S)-2-haloacid dehalogenase 4A n=1 Tax=Kingella potus TaxID=265175 RepID=A0A377R2T2_9NEIS|nr:pyrimidine 5'-nucleotidase [Kingella potus]UOP00952.1 pyrimidine 5'-nucleotidase [Kingella potus]STR00611.1 (S)-2-haloacid dehalogenase 4A [Kingella potus]
MSDTVWLFDLDNTLHHADAGIFCLINRRMTEWLAANLHLHADEADRLRRRWWHEYGATLTGLRLHHPAADAADFLRFAHPMAAVLPLLRGEAGAADTIGRLKGRKAVLSNAPSFYVRALIPALGLDGCFDALLGTDDCAFACKPDPAAYLAACAALDVPPECCIMADDSAANLAAAKTLGMRTVWYGAHAHPLPFADCAARNMAELAAWAEQAV